MAQSQVVPVDAKPVVAAAPPPVPSGLRRFPLNATVCVWAALALATAVLARQNGSVPGLYYDEACLAGGAKEFVTGQTRGRHMPWYLAVDVLGRPFPLFFQSYSGALKGWMLIPVFAVFGSSLVALRWASLGWTLLALLVFMLWVRRWQGDRVAITAGVLLGLDPSWFFIGVLWGPLIGSFLSRCVCFYLTLRWFREGKMRYAFFAALAAGLGFFNKVDFVVLLAGASAAAVACYWRALVGLVRARPAALAVAVAGILAGAGPILVNSSVIGARVGAGNHTRDGNELSEKVATTLAMYDGSYYYRLMDSGGVFRNMGRATPSVWPAFSIALVAALLVLATAAWNKSATRQSQQNATFVLLAVVLVTSGLFIMPGAVRLHHATLVYPFPHLAVGMAAVYLWGRFPAGHAMRNPLRLTTALVLLAVVAGQVLAIQRTEQLLTETGGRGRWAECLDQFCAEVKDRADLTIVSLDWGFNEQLIFLTDAPTLCEPIWGPRPGEMPPPLDSENVIYLLHPPEYALYAEYNNPRLDAAVAGAAAGRLELRPYRDRQDRVAFYTVRRLPRSGVRDSATSSR